MSNLHRLQKTLFADARDAPVGHQVEVLTLRLNRGQPHPFTAFDAGHLDGGLKAGTGRRRPGDLQHRVLEFPKRKRNATRTNKPAFNMSDSRHNWNKLREVPGAKIKLFETLPDSGRTNRQPRRDRGDRQGRGQTPRSRWISCLDRRRLYPRQGPA